MAEELEDTYIQELCATQPLLMTVYFTFTIPLLNAIVVCCIIGGAFVYAKAFKNGQIEMNKRMFYCILLLFVILIATAITQSLLNILFCSKRHYYALSPFFMCLYNLKTILFVGILFWRVYQSFKGSNFKLSKCSLIFFTLYYGMVCLMGALSVIMMFMSMGAASVDSLRPGYMLAGMTSTLVSLLTIYLVILFIYKLNQTYHSFRVTRAAAGDISRVDDNLVSIMTKIALLFFLSALAVVTVAALQGLAVRIHNVHLVLVANTLVLVDVYLNFLCVVLVEAFRENVYDIMRMLPFAMPGVLR